MFLVVAYDIANPKRLRRVAKVMKKYGARVQESVFECRLDPLRLTALRQELQALLQRREDKVTLYPLCDACQHHPAQTHPDVTPPSVAGWFV